MKSIITIILALLITGSVWATVSSNDVNGPMTIRGPLTVEGDLTVADPYVISFSDNFAITGNQTLTGNQTISGTSAVTGAVTFSSTLSIAGGISDPSAQVDISDSMAVSGATTFNDDVTLGAGDDLLGSSTSDIKLNTNKFTAAGATGNVGIAGNITDPTDDVDINDSCTIAGAAYLSSTLDVTGLASFTGGVVLETNACTITNTSGNFATAGTATVAGLASFTGGVVLETNACTVTNTSGNFKTEGTLIAVGSSTLAALSVSGNITDPTDDVDIADTCTISADLYAGEDILLTGYIQDAVDDVDINDTVTVSGAATFSSSLSAQGITTTTLTTTGDIVDSVDDVDINDSCTVASGLTINTYLTIPSGTSLPGTPASGSLFLDTDAGDSGTLYIYTPSGTTAHWAVVQALP